MGAPTPPAAVEQEGTVILEHAILDVVPGEEQRFEAAFQRAQHIIAAIAGFRSLRLERCVETPARYLHHFYDPFPLVEHYESVFRR